MFLPCKKIENRFSKAVQSYSLASAVQQEAGQLLLDLVEAKIKKIPKTFLDLGTGTGTLIVKASDRWPLCRFYLNDLSESMFS